MDKQKIQVDDGDKKGKKLSAKEKKRLKEEVLPSRPDFIII